MAQIVTTYLTTCPHHQPPNVPRSRIFPCLFHDFFHDPSVEFHGRALSLVRQSSCVVSREIWTCIHVLPRHLLEPLQCSPSNFHHQSSFNAICRTPSSRFCPRSKLCTSRTKFPCRSSCQIFEYKLNSPSPLFVYIYYAPSCHNEFWTISTLHTRTTHFSAGVAVSQPILMTAPIDHMLIRE